MKTRTAACPSCGGPVEFHISTSLVTICQFCNSAVARSDKAVEDHGKVADIVQTDSRLQRGLRGSYAGKSFEVVGRVQYAHPAGGTWDEWYLTFPGDRWGWLSEAQGRRYLTFEKRLKATSALPSFDALNAGAAFTIGDLQLTVAEKGIAKTLSAEGEIPWNFQPGQTQRFADLEGANGVFGTFEYEDESGRFFLGKEVALDELSLEGEGWTTDETSITVGALALSCPQCGGPISLRAPDKTERVFCDNCHSLLDASGGKLEYFKTLDAQKVHPLLPLGGEGTLLGDRYTVIGFMARYAMYAGQRYPWSEYLLYNPDLGFRWLVYNDRHWMFAQPIPVHEIDCDSDVARYDAKRFKVYDRGTAFVRYVLGEFYWRVEVGDQVATVDYIAPPQMISFERTQQGAGSEVNVSLSTYVPVEDIEQAFEVSNLPRPWGVAPCQPNPPLDWRVFLLWPVFAFILVATYVLLAGSTSTTGSDPILLILAILGVSTMPIGMLLYRYHFEVQRWKDSDYSPYSTD